MSDRSFDDDAPSLALLLIDALAFWLRNQMVFWLTALPIAGLGAAVTYVLDIDRQFIDWRNHWGWNFLFALIYAMFLDRWIKEALIDEAIPCDEVDELRRSTIAIRFLSFAAVLCLMATMLALAAPLALGVVLWAATAALFALLLPGLAAAEPISLREAFALGRPRQRQIFFLIGVAAALSLLAGWGLHSDLLHLPARPWADAVLAAGQRLIDCLVLTFVGYGLAVIFRHSAGWQPPESEDHPFSPGRLRTRKA
jgi:hypothetical protein